MTSPPSQSWTSDDEWGGLDGFDPDHFAGFDDSDTPAEVDAAFRSQRRIAIGYFAVFCIVIIGSVGATTIGPWATKTRVGEAFNPAFLLAGLVLFVVFTLIAIAAASLADAVDDRMLGAGSLPDQEKSYGE